MKSKLMMLTACAALFGVVSGQAQDFAINQRIVQFCQDHLGQKVGDGECFALANQALHEAGGTRKFRDNPGKGDYVWGEMVFAMEPGAATGSLESVQPGDIIQFRDCRFQHKRSWVSFGHHTAVVSEVKDGGKELKIYQENYGGKRFVTQLTLHPKDLTKGWFRIYQPEMKRK